MKKYIFILLVVLSSCSKKIEDKKNNLIEIQDFETISYADSVEIKLLKTKDIDVNIKNKIQQVKVLSSENNNLKVELKTTKDCLISTQQRFEVFKTSVKVPKKRNFLQRLVGAKTDSVEVEKIDSIQK
jgi:hypothetical protein